MMLPKVYIETSVVSYLTAWPSREKTVLENQTITKEWWRTCRERFELFASDLVETEAMRGDPQAAEERLDVLATITGLTTTEAAQRLAKTLIRAGAIPEVAADDALHVAIAAVNGMDYLVTWNLRHINNETKLAEIGEACRLAGFESPIICSPRDLKEKEHV